MNEELMTRMKDTTKMNDMTKMKDMTRMKDTLVLITRMKGLKNQNQKLRITQIPNQAMMALTFVHCLQNKVPAQTGHTHGIMMQNLLSVGSLSMEAALEMTTCLLTRRAVNNDVVPMQIGLQPKRMKDMVNLNHLSLKQRTEDMKVLNLTEGMKVVVELTYATNHQIWALAISSNTLGIMILNWDIAVNLCMVDVLEMTTDLTMKNHVRDVVDLELNQYLVNQTRTTMVLVNLNHHNVQG